MCKKGCKKGFCSCIRTTDPGLFDHAPSIDKTARFPLRYWKAGEALHNYYLSFEDIALKVNNTPVGYVPTTSGNTTDLNTVVIDSSGDKWIIDILGNAIKMPTGGGGAGTVTSFSSGNLSPLFTTSVATPTTTPVLSFALSNVSQYQVFGRSAAGNGAPSWITLPSTAFTGYTAGTGISIAGNVISSTATPVAWADEQIAFGKTASGGLDYDYYYRFDYTAKALTLGYRSVGTLGYYTFSVGAANLLSGSNVFGIGSGNTSTGSDSIIVGNNNTNTNGNSAVVGYLNTNNGDNCLVTGRENLIESGTYYASIIGSVNQLKNASPFSTIIGYNNIINNATGSYVIGRNASITHQGNIMLTDWTGSTLASSDLHMLSLRFYNGVRFLKDASTLQMSIDSSGLVYIANIPNAPSATSILVSNSGIISYRTLSSLFTQYWQVTSGFLNPNSSSYGDIMTYNNSGTWGDIRLNKGSGSQSGYLSIVNVSGTRLGYIGYYNSNMSYHADSGFHKFYNRPVQIDSVANDNALTKFAVFGTANEIKYRDLSSISIGSDVWRITGGNTIATSITDSIWHNANVKLGDGSSGSNSYRLQVVGTSYFTQTMLINNSTAFNALNASASPVEVFKVDSSNNWLFAASHIKVNATDIYIDQYPNTRSDSFYTVQAARLMYTDSNGKILLTDKKAFYNDHVSSGTKTQQSHAADSTWRRLTNDLTYGSISFGTQFNTNGTTFACQIPRTDQRFWLVSIIEYENQSGSSGTPVIDLQIRVNGSTTGVIFSDWSEATTGVRNTVTIQSILYTAGGGGYYDVDIYIRVATGSGSIYVNKHDTVITNVGYIPS